jgi:AraC-like DNA-binding protein
MLRQLANANIDRSTPAQPQHRPQAYACDKIYTREIGPARSELKVPQLAKWRLKRAIEYIEQRLAEPITLADIASETGLSRMYFASQFRAATGVGPHEYLVRRRIERAQELLLQPNASVVDVALSVGFKTQAHFTTIFGRFVGQSPHAWRIGCQRNQRLAGG